MAGTVVGAGSADEEAPPAPVLGYCDEQPIERVAGHRVMVRMEGRATPALLDQARRGQIGGVVLFPPSEIAGDRLAGELDRLQRAATEGDHPRLLVAIDQEGGIVERLPALPPQVSPYTMAQNDDRSAAKLEGSATGFQLREIGVDVNLAPVLDVPASDDQFMAPRAFGSTPAQASRLGLAFASGQRAEAVAATAKHFPGLGRATENTDLAPVAIDASAAALASDIEPFRDAAAAGIDLVMLASAAYPRLGSRAPAVLAPEVATELLREDVGFTGVSVSDDLLAPAISTNYTRREASELAAAAGVDMLLFAADEAPGIARGLVSASRAGIVSEESMRASCARIVSLKQQLATGEPLE